MKKEFRKFSDNTKVDLLEYCRDMIAINPDVKIYIGCDSQNSRNKTNYVTAIVFRFPSKGASVIMQYDKVPMIKDMWSKLWGELQRSIDIAGYIRFEGNIPIEKIELDFNEDPLNQSNTILKTAIGYVESLGYSVSFKDTMKGNSRDTILISTWIADKACRV